MISPNDAIDREEAAFMIGKAFGVKPYQILYKEFSDSADISPWAEPFVCAMYHYGFINGMGSGVFQPKGKVTRAQVATILNNMVGYYISAPGTYKISSTDSKVLVNCNSVNLKFSGCTTINLFASPGVNDNTLTEEFSNCSTELTLTEFDVGTTSTISMQSTVYPTVIFTDINDEIDKGFAGGKGTPDDPYLIETQEQLKQLNNYYAAGYGYACSPYKYFKLNNDITIFGNWTPIADQSIVIKMSHRVSGFFGELNGAGHSINYSIEADDSKIQCPGLFGGLCGLVRKLNVKANISGTSESWTTIGGIAGDLSYYFTSRGLVQNCNADVTINASGKSLSVGGIAGGSIGTISNCSANVKINAVAEESVYAGGIIGSTYGNIDNCRSTGSISAECNQSDRVIIKSAAGGIVGSAVSASDCFSSAEVSSKEGNISNAGGLIGVLDSSNSETEHQVTRCYSTGSASASDGFMRSNAGGLIGCIEKGSVYNCWASATVTVTGTPPNGNCVGGFVGAAYDESAIADCWSTGRNVTSEGTPAGIGGFFGYTSGHVNRVYCCCSSNLSNKNALVDKALNMGVVKESYDITNMSAEKLQTAYKEWNWDFVKLWNKDIAIYPVLRGINEEAQIKAMLNS